MRSREPRARPPHEGEPRMLPTLPRITPGQVLLSSGAFLATGLLDVAIHFGDGTVIFVGLMAAGVVTRHSRDILDFSDEVLDMLIPGRNAQATIDATARILDATAPEDEDTFETSELDQAPLAKLKRLFSFGPPPPRTFAPARLKEAREDEELLEDDQDEEEEGKPTLLHLGPAFFPHPDALFSNRLVILGMPGAGKSNTVAVLSEELGQYPAPLIIFDQKPEYGPLCAHPYLTNPLRANAATVTPSGAFAFGQRLMDERLQVVLDLPSYKNDDDAARVMIGIIGGVWAWEEARGNRHRIPCTFFLEEADYWLPQAENHAHVNRAKGKDGRSLFTELQQAFFDLVHRGRSFGMGIVVSTQRPANIDNRAIAVAEWKFLLKANMPGDLKVYQGFGLDPDAAQALGKGEAYVIGPDIKGTFRIRLRKSPDEAQTPGLANLQRKPTKSNQTVYRPSSPSVPPSQASSVSPSFSPSFSPSDASFQMPRAEGDRNELRSATKGTEGETPLRQLSERERRIGELFFHQNMNPNAIIKVIYPDIKGGDAYTKASAEIAEAIRTYFQAQQRGGV